jgi:hypothetical protein
VSRADPNRGTATGGKVREMRPGPGSLGSLVVSCKKAGIGSWHDDLGTMERASPLSSRCTESFRSLRVPHQPASQPAIITITPFESSH